MTADSNPAEQIEYNKQASVRELCVRWKMHLWLLFVWTKIVRWLLLHSAWLSKLKFCRDSQLILCDIMLGMSASTCRRRDLGRSEMYFRTMHKQHNHGTSWRPKFAKPGGFNGWCIQLDVYFMENPNEKWKIWGYPHFRKPPYILLSSIVYI